MPRGASILIIQRPWIDLILDGHKTLEIRSQRCSKAAGERIYRAPLKREDAAHLPPPTRARALVLCRSVALSGGGGIILGSAKFVASHGPLSGDEWRARADEHCVAGNALPYGGSRTFAWQVTEPMRFRGARAGLRTAVKKLDEAERASCRCCVTTDRLARCTMRVSQRRSHTRTSMARWCGP